MTVNLQWPDCVVCPVSMGAMGWCAIEYRQYVSIVAHLLGCFFFLWLLCTDVFLLFFW